MLKFSFDATTKQKKITAWKQVINEDTTSLLQEEQPDPQSEDYKIFSVLNTFEEPVEWDESFLMNKQEFVDYCKYDGVSFVADKSADPDPVKAERAFSSTESLVGIDRLVWAGEGPSNVWIRNDLNKHLTYDMADEKSDIRRISNLPIKRSFVYLDVSDFSKFKSQDQLLIINSIVNIVRDLKLWHLRQEIQDTRANAIWVSRTDLEASLCIGDGYIYVFSNEYFATRFACHLAALIDIAVARGVVPVEFHFRMGVGSGEVRCFYDPGRRDWNYIGEGINTGQRILSAIEKDTDDVLYVSSDVRKAINALKRHTPYSELLSNMTNKGRKKDKHGEMRRVYEINFSNVIAEYKQILNFNHRLKSV